MLTLDDFHYELPSELIATHPVYPRTHSRMLVLPNQGEKIDSYFYQLMDYLQEGDLLLFNHSKVIPARLYGHKLTGGKVEILIERITNENTAIAHLRASKRLLEGTEIRINDSLSITVLGRHGDLYKIAFPQVKTVLAWLDEFGQMPIPPYFQRQATAQDKQDYQCVYAKEVGSVAAPTAGLHFDEELLLQLQKARIQFAYLTLHVGAGTFQPVREQDISQHHMHSEYFAISEQVCEQIKQTRAQGRRVICVGTTSLRALQSAIDEQGQLVACERETDIFIYPPYQFRYVDGLITNFHLPGSTLLMLIGAFYGYPDILSVYHYAVAEKYRFFSYGDAMLILKISSGEVKKCSLQD